MVSFVCTGRGLWVLLTFLLACEKAQSFPPFFNFPKELPSTRPVTTSTKSSRRTLLKAVEQSAYSPKINGSNDGSQRINGDEYASLPPGNRRKGMGIALAATYFTVMAAKCALPSVLPLLIDPKYGLTFPSGRQPQQLMARQLTLATLAVASGKVLLGPVIDRLGGIRSLQVALVVLALLLGTIASSQHFYVFAVSWIFVDFVFSSCWAGCINAIHQSFPQNEWTNRVGSLAASARAGNAVAFAFFAMVLKLLSGNIQQSWRPVFAIAAVAQAVPLLLLTIFGKNVIVVEDSIREERSFKDTLTTIAREGRTLPFWLQLVSRSMLMVYASFLLFVPTYMSQVYNTGSALAAQSGSVYALGCLLAVSFGCPLYTRLKKAGRVSMNAILLSLSILASGAQVAHLSGWCTLTVPMSVGLFFLWGFSFAVPFYSKCCAHLSRFRCLMISLISDLPILQSHPLSTPYLEVAESHLQQSRISLM